MADAQRLCAGRVFKESTRAARCEARRDDLLLHMRAFKKPAQMRRKSRRNQVHPTCMDSHCDGTKIFLLVQTIQEPSILRWYAQQNACRRSGQIIRAKQLQVIRYSIPVYRFSLVVLIAWYYGKRGMHSIRYSTSFLAVRPCRHCKPQIAPLAAAFCAPLKKKPRVPSLRGPESLRLQRKRQRNSPPRLSAAASGAPTRHTAYISAAAQRCLLSSSA